MLQVLRLLVKVYIRYEACLDEKLHMKTETFINLNNIFAVFHKLLEVFEISFLFNLYKDWWYYGRMIYII